MYFHDVKYAAHLNCPVVIPALVGEAVLSAVNSSMDTWDQSAEATLIERHLIDWTSGRLGLGPTADGIFTSGGSQSNLQALLIARHCAHARLADEPPRLPEVLPRMRVLTSEVSHFSIRKSASILGLGDDAVITIATDAGKRMDTDALRVALRDCLAEGLVPIAVVGTAGTTDFGSIGPLVEVSAICRSAGVWLHVDAAYGGGVITSTRHARLLDGIRAADSVTIDYHKTFFQPVSSSALLVRDGSTFGHVTYHADSLNPRAPAAAFVPNQADKSIQTTRRFDALKLWLTLRTMGADGIGALLDEVIDLAWRTGKVLQAAPDFEVVGAPELSTLVFRHLPPAQAALTAPSQGDRTDRMKPVHPARDFRVRAGRDRGDHSRRAPLPEVHPPEPGDDPRRPARDHRSHPAPRRELCRRRELRRRRERAGPYLRRQPHKRPRRRRCTTSSESGSARSTSGPPH